MNSIHRTVNRILATIALILSIVLMVAVLWIGLAAYHAAGQIGDKLDDIGNSQDAQPTDTDPAPDGDLNGLPDECWNPGGGEVCAPGGADGLPGGN